MRDKNYELFNINNTFIDLKRNLSEAYDDIFELMAMHPTIYYSSLEMKEIESLYRAIEKNLDRVKDLHEKKKNDFYGGL